MRLVHKLLLWLVLILPLAGCEQLVGPQNRPSPNSAAVLQPIPQGESKPAVIRQQIYVPAYSEIYFETQNRTLDLSVTLSVRNTDSKQAIRLDGINYYDMRGRLVRNYLPKPRLLSPLATVNFIIDRKDREGGVTPSFGVEWQADALVSQPIAESVMVSAVSNQGLSLLSKGQVVWQEGRSPRP